MLSDRVCRLLGALTIAGALLPGQGLAAAPDQGAQPKKHRTAHHAKKYRIRHKQAAQPLVVPIVYQPAIEPVLPSPVGWLVTVGTKVGAAPKYIGAKRYGAIGAPILSFRRPGTPVNWSSPDDSLLYAVYEGPYFSFGPVLSFRGGRYSDNTGGQFYGIHKSKWTLEPGAFVDAWLYPEFIRIHAELRRGFRGDDGLVGTLGADYIMKWDRFTLALGPRAKFGNDHFLNQQFGITEGDAIASPRFKQPYKAKGGLYALGAFGSITWQPSESWTYTLHASYDRLRQDAAASPLVRAAGSKNQFGIGLIVSYTFSWDGIGWNGF